MRHTSRRLRRDYRRAPQWVIKVDRQISREEAHQIKEAWRAAGREGVAVLGPHITVTRLR